MDFGLSEYNVSQLADRHSLISCLPEPHPKHRFLIRYIIVNIYILKDTMYKNNISINSNKIEFSYSTFEFSNLFLNIYPCFF